MLDVAGAGPRGVNKSLLDVAGLLIMRKPGNERAGKSTTDGSDERSSGDCIVFILTYLLSYLLT